MKDGTPIPLLSLAICASLLQGVIAAAPEVTAMKAPNEAWRPQVVLDAAGTVHLVYTSMDESARGDLFYVRRKEGEKEFSTPIKVNTAPQCTAAFYMAVGKGGRVHVFIRANARYAAEILKRKLKFIDLKYMLYCRLNDEGTAFEEERNLAGETFGFEGSGLLLPDGRGTVYAFWHGLGEVGPERSRSIFMAKSEDEGKRFSKGIAIEKRAEGTCACCPLHGAMDAEGNFYIAYRNSEASLTKDSYLLVSRDQGKTFTETLLDPWAEAGCPGANYSVTTTAAGAYVAWRTRHQVYFSMAGEKSRRIAAPIGENQSRSPVVVASSKGHLLFAWAEGTGAAHFQQGGDLAWQIYDAEGRPISEKKVLPSTIARWSSPAAYATPEGDFVILYDGAGLPE